MLAVRRVPGLVYDNVAGTTARCFAADKRHCLSPVRSRATRTVMPYNYRFCHDDACGYVEMYGEITGRDLSGALKSVYENPRWRPSLPVLWDGRRISSLVLTPEDIKAVSELTGTLKDKMGEGQVAIVVTRQIDYHSAILLALRSQRRPDREVRIFHSLAEAAEWLGVPLDAFPEIPDEV